MKLTKMDKRLISVEVKQESGIYLAMKYKVTPAYISQIVKKAKDNPDLDFNILIKMIPVFIQAGLKVDLSNEEISRMKEIIGVLKPNV
jgi:hypothetical protein